jgi:hypothetical protein
MTTKSTTTGSPNLPQKQTPAPAPLSEATQKVIEQLRQQAVTPLKKRDQRSSERRPWVAHLTLLITDPLGKPRTLDVVTHDISTGGFSFIFRQFFHVNTRVRAQFETLPGKPVLDGVVRSCILVGGVHHRVGVQFDTARPPE